MWFQPRAPIAQSLEAARESRERIQRAEALIRDIEDIVNSSLPLIRSTDDAPAARQQAGLP